MSTHFFSKILRTGAHTPIQRSWQVSADKKPHCKESPFSPLHSSWSKVLNIYIPHGRLWKAGERTLVFSRGCFIHSVSHSSCLSLIRWGRISRKEDIIDCEKIFAVCFPHLFIIKCFSTTPAHRNGNGPRAGDELHSYRTRDCASRLCFPFSY